MQQPSHDYLILSGGGKSHFTSEAKAMYDFISSHYRSMLVQTLLEELSTDTLQNALFSKNVKANIKKVHQLAFNLNPPVMRNIPQQLQQME